MTIYVVKNKDNEEVASYTDLNRAKDLAEQVRYEFSQDYSIEKLHCELDHEESSAT